MHKKLSVDDIARELIQDENAGWSREGAHALAEHLDGDETRDRMDFDRVEVRCSFSEYKDAVEAAVAYGWDDEVESKPVGVYPHDNDAANEADRESRALLFLSGLTTVILVGYSQSIWDGVTNKTGKYSSIIIENFPNKRRPSNV